MNKADMILNKIEKDHSRWLIETASEPKMVLLIFMSRLSYQLHGFTKKSYNDVMNSSSRECGMNLLNVFLDNLLKKKKKIKK
jgi:hypothetical protein